MDVRTIVSSDTPASSTDERTVTRGLPKLEGGLEPGPFEFDRLRGGGLTAYRFLNHYDCGLYSPNSCLSEHSLQNKIRILRRSPRSPLGGPPEKFKAEAGVELDSDLLGGAGVNPQLFTG